MAIKDIGALRGADETFGHGPFAPREARVAAVREQGMVAP